METNNSETQYSNADQLKKYADDLVKVYKSEQQKRKDLENTNLQLIKYGRDLSSSILKLKTANQELSEAYLDTIHRLVIAAEYKDEDTASHIVRIGSYSAMIAKKLGMPDKKAINILYAAPMHDIGKIGIPDNILFKPGKLTDEEFEIMKKHTVIEAKILSNSKSAIIKLGEEIALTHHERWDGKGYPNQLSGKHIPLAGRVVAIADVFDALMSKRPYKEASTLEVTLDIMQKERGKHFDPDILDIFMKNIDEILKIRTGIEKTGPQGSEKGNLEISLLRSQ